MFARLGNAQSQILQSLRILRGLRKVSRGAQATAKSAYQVKVDKKLPFAAAGAMPSAVVKDSGSGGGNGSQSGSRGIKQTKYAGTDRLVYLSVVRYRIY
jgi:hypothetical protein